MYVVCMKKIYVRISQEKKKSEQGNTASLHIERTTSFGHHRVFVLCFGFLKHGFLGKPKLKYPEVFATKIYHICKCF